MKIHSFQPIIYILTIGILCTPLAVFAQYQPLVGLPGIGTDTSSFDAYIETIYAVTITVAAMLAVIKIVIAGVKYMTTDIVTSKGDAKADIRGAILGLLVVLAAVLIIEVINPDINDVNLTLTTQAPPPSVAAPGGIPMAPYTAQNGPGYIFIDNDAPAGQINQFIADCDTTAGYTLIRNFQTRQIRCNAPANSAVVTSLTNHLTTGPNPVSSADVDAIITQYSTYVAPFAITDASTLATIQSENGASDVFFAVDMFVPNPAFATDPTQPENVIMTQTQLDQFAGICNRVAQAQGLDMTGNDPYVVVDRGTNIASCLRP